MKNSVYCPLVAAVLFGACGGATPADEGVAEAVEVVQASSEIEYEIEPEVRLAPEPATVVQTEIALEDLLIDDAEPETPSIWEGFDAVLSEYVTEDGGFRYEALAENGADLIMLVTFLNDVAAIELDSLDDDERLALLINAYNAYTIHSVLELWPIDGVLEEDGFFDGREHFVGGSSMTLNELENEHIRAAFGEPRIHFVVNCASTGCPWLSPEAVTADNLEMMLDRQSRAFLQRTTLRDGDHVEVSQIFDWFADDFEVSGGVRAFLVEHLAGELADTVADDDTDIEFFDYDWSVNAR